MAVPFPLIRHASRVTTPWLARLPLTANQITTLSLAAGLAAGWTMTSSQPSWIVAGALALCVSYVLDNCDGEIARLKNQVSTFGAYLDDIADWIIHATFFIGLGYGHAARTGQETWLWLGVAAALGSSLNYVLTLLPGRKKEETESASPDNAPLPSGPADWIVFAFRELARADFCILVLILALFDLVWVLLPAAAVGAQIYWIMQFYHRARDYHV